jgi:hypothetical protein
MTKHTAESAAALNAALESPYVSLSWRDGRQPEEHVFDDHVEALAFFEATRERMLAEQAAGTRSEVDVPTFFTNLVVPGSDLGVGYEPARTDVVLTVTAEYAFPSRREAEDAALRLVHSFADVPFPRASLTVAARDADGALAFVERPAAGDEPARVVLAVA